LERLTELKSEIFYFCEMFHFREPKILEIFSNFRPTMAYADLQSKLQIKTLKGS